MTIKLPRVTIEELDGLIEQLSKNDVKKRDNAMVRLTEFERSGKIPIEVLLELSEAESPPVSMYAISALGRNGDPAAVKKLLQLLEKNRKSNPLFLETIVDALGQARSPSASAALLNLIGIKAGKMGKLFGKRKTESSEEEDSEARLQEYLTLPVIRALEKIEDPKAALQIADYLSHSDYLVRWHAVQIFMKCNLSDFNDKLREMSKKDENELVREIADIALSQLAVLPPNLNN